MQHTIEHHFNTSNHLIVTGRKKAQYNHLVAPVTGAILVRLGKLTHYVAAGQHFWINQDCLQSLLILPHTEWQAIQISVRSQHSFSPQAGLMHHPLLTPILDELRNQPSEELSRHLLNTLHQLLSELRVATQTKHSMTLDNSKVLHGHKKVFDALAPNDIELVSQCLHLAEAVKMKRSGKKMEVIAEQLGLDIQQLINRSQLLLGEDW
ncbi:hypothetical protein [Thaumasiovibrio subtropicus]|uniref:hypothetical protein n=1 Tax=Thaumasiovibrio subtropicus TaxID=1891207 RepID=UPI000B360CE3|nr:hypothetical protein [Thaumasiovibrio subtropicus]